MQFESTLYRISSISFSLHFNGHFPDGSTLAGSKAQIKSPPKKQHPVFLTGCIPFQSPNQQCSDWISCYGKYIHLYSSILV